MTRDAKRGGDDMAIGSPFRIDWLEPGLSPREREEIERGVALAAANVLRSARFARTLGERAGQDLEVRLWLETGLDPLQVAVWWEPRMRSFWFPVVNPADGSRLALVVFERVRSVARADLDADEAHFAAALADGAGASRRVAVRDVRATVENRLVDSGVER